jgi:hypothetical protein
MQYTIEKIPSLEFIDDKGKLISTRGYAFIDKYNYVDLCQKPE